MKEIKKIYTTYEEIIENIDKYIDIFLTEKVFGFKELYATEQQQRTIMCKMGDKLNWLPNSKYPKGHRYVENHENALTVFPNTNKDELVVKWHLEHCSVKYSQCGATWNMTKFNCDPTVGTTGFIDNSQLYYELPEKWQQFLDRCTIMDYMQGDLAENFDDNFEFKSHDGYTYRSVPRKAVFVHPQTLKKIIRINPIYVFPRLMSIDDRKPTQDEQDFLVEIADFYRNEVWNNPDRPMWWQWSEGDLLVPDLWIMIHGVRGGFDYGEREFVGYWSYPPGSDELFPDLLWDPQDENYIL